MLANEVNLNFADCSGHASIVHNFDKVQLGPTVTKWHTCAH